MTTLKQKAQAVKDEWIAQGSVNGLSELLNLILAQDDGPKCKTCGDETVFTQEGGLVSKTTANLMAELTRLREQNERMKQCLQLIAAPKRADGTYNRCREACEQLARDLLNELKAT